MEAGKKAATRLLELQKSVREKLRATGKTTITASELAKEIDSDPEDVYHILVHLAANANGLSQAGGDAPGKATFQMS